MFAVRKGRNGRRLNYPEKKLKRGRSKGGLFRKLDDIRGIEIFATFGMDEKMDGFFRFEIQINANLLFF